MEVVMQTKSSGASFPAVPDPAPMTQRPTLALLIPLAACHAATPDLAPPIPDAIRSDAHQVAISGFRFRPDTLRVPVGTTVTWTNLDMTLHQVWSEAVADTFRSERLSVHGTFSHTFKIAGIFQYLCPPHPGMQAVIIVQ
jgi:plastocyanin